MLSKACVALIVLGLFAFVLQPVEAVPQTCPLETMANYNQPQTHWLHTTVVGEIYVLPRVYELKVGEGGWIATWDYNYKTRQVKADATVVRNKDECNVIRIDQTVTGLQVTMSDEVMFNPK